MGEGKDCNKGMDSIVRDLTQEDRANEKSKYMQSRQQSRVTGANAVPVARATVECNGA